MQSGRRYLLAPLGLLDVCGGKPQPRTDLFGYQLDLGAGLASVGLLAALLERPGHDGPHALGEREGHVLGQIKQLDV